MKRPDLLEEKIFSLIELQRRVMQWRVTGKSVAFTNGVFDVLHEGHLSSIAQAAVEASYLVVAINSDASVKRLKGDDRPVHAEHSRALMLAAMLMVDAVIIFDEDTPLNVITTLLPDVIVKGGDYTEDSIVGANEVKANGGKVVINPLVQGFSTTAIIDRIKSHQPPES